MRLTLEESLSDGRGFYVVSGMGDDSAMMIAELFVRGYEPEAIIFCDTGNEWPHTMAFVAKLQTWMLANDWSELVVLDKRNKDGVKTSVYSENFKNGRMPPPVYGFKTCSHRFKREPADRYLAEREGHKGDKGRISWKGWDKKIIKCVGINADEDHRIGNWVEDENFDQVFPLVDWDIGEKEAIETVEAVGLYMPGKSSCFMCPNATADEVVKLYREHPFYFYMAIAMEQNVVQSGNDVTDTDVVVFYDAVSKCEFTVPAKKTKGEPDIEKTIKSLKKVVRQQLRLEQDEYQQDFFGTAQIEISLRKEKKQTEFVGLGRNKSWLDVVKYWQMTGQIDAFSDIGGEMCANGGCGT